MGGTARRGRAAGDGAPARRALLVETAAPPHLASAASMLRRNTMFSSTEAVLEKLYLNTLQVVEGREGGGGAGAPFEDGHASAQPTEAALRDAALAQPRQGQARRRAP